MKISSNKSLSSNMIWHFAEKWGCQIISFLITIVVSRLIDPSSYGVVAIINTFLQIFTVFVDGGLGNALIQKKDADDLDFSIVFYSNLVLCTSIYLILFFAAPYIASYYAMPEITSLLRVSAITILISALQNIQNAYVSKNLMFEKFFFASLTGTIGSGVIGIILALKGYEAWALVISRLFDVVVDTFCMCFLVKWKPQFKFSFERFKSLFDFGSKVLLQKLINRLYNKAYHLVIGKLYSSADLAYYDKGNSITSKIADNTDSVINSVLFPVMANKQDSIEEVKKIAKKSLKINTYVMTPLLVGIIVVCEPMVSVILTDKWLLAVPYIRLFCLINILLPFQTINANVIQSMGKGDLLLKQEFIKKGFGILLLLITLRISPLAIVIGKLILNCFYVIIDSYPNKKIIDYGMFEQIYDILPNLFISVIMGIIVYVISYLNMSNILILLIQIIVGILIYLLLSILTRNDSYIYLLNLIKKKLIRKKA